MVLNNAEASPISKIIFDYLEVKWAQYISLFCYPVWLTLLNRWHDVPNMITSHAHCTTICLGGQY
jgi:hypothetical protein